MKAISILQPWASLIAIGKKRIETRSWPTKYRGPLAIHDSKDRAPWHMNLAWQEPFFSALKPFHRKEKNEKIGIQYNLGCVIATCNLVDIYEIGDGMIFKRIPSGMIDFGSRVWPSAQEIAFGDFTPGRFAWMLENVQQIEPVPAKGRLGLWEWEMPGNAGI